MSDIGESTEMATDLVMEESDVDRTRAARPKWHVQVALATMVLALPSTICPSLR